jgi:KRAB domain-containing zinc finger protein
LKFEIENSPSPVLASPGPASPIWTNSPLSSIPTSPEVNNLEDQSSLSRLELQNKCTKGSNLKTLFKCVVCSKHFGRKSDLTRHYSTKYHRHNATNSVKSILTSEFQCEICGVHVHSKGKMERHMRYHTQKFDLKRLLKYRQVDVTGSTKKVLFSEIQCPICDKPMASKYKLKGHMRYHFPWKEKFECVVCSKQFGRKPDLRRHYSTKYHRLNATNTAESILTSEYVCEICGEHVHSKGRMERHMRYHMKKFDSIRLSKYPQVEVTGFVENNLISEFHCPICDKPIESKYKLKKHMRFHFPQRVKFECVVCSKQFEKRFRLTRHFNTKSHQLNVQCAKNTILVSKFQCDMCSEHLHDKNEMERHMRYHIKHYNKRTSKIMTCDFCSKQFSKKQNLIGHVYAHLNKENFYCYMCKKIYNTINELKFHVADMSCKKAVGWKCSFCSLSFESRDIYMLHNQCEHEIHFTKTVSGTKEANLYCPKSSLRTMYLNNSIKKSHNLLKNLDLSCKACGEAFKNIYELRVHTVKQHNTEVPKYTCPKCNSSFLRKHKLMKHLETAHAVGDFMCEICGISFSNEEELECHYLVHEYPTLNCQICNKSFATNNALKMHIFYKHAVPNFPNTGRQQRRQLENTDDILKETDVLLLECDFCTELFISERELETHMRYHLKHIKNNNDSVNSTSNNIDTEMMELLKDEDTVECTSFPCPLCDAEFEYVKLLDQHMNKSHKGAMNIPCKLCQTVVKSIRIYISHVKSVHYLKSDLKIQCPYCFKVMRRKYMFIRHFGGSLPPDLNFAACCKPSNQIVTKEKGVFNCPYCENVYKAYNGLAKHKRDYHPEEHKHICKMCNKKFFALCKVMKHETYVHKRFKYSCPYCKETFKKEGQVQPHVLKHHKGKPAYFCAECNIIFTTARCMQNHVKKHTNALFVTHRAQVADTITDNTSSACLVEAQTDKTCSNSKPGVHQESCPHCDLKFPNFDVLKIHVCTVHEQMPCYSCTLCGKAYDTIKAVTRHIGIIHEKRLHRRSGEKRCLESANRANVSKKCKIHKCGKCGMEHSHIHAYLKHVSKCKSSVLCEKCGRKFPSRSLPHHKLRCNKINYQYQCGKCSVKFEIFDQFKKHMLEHELHWSDKLTCSHCPQSFNDIYKVINHYKSCHKNLLPLPLFCKLCDYNCDNYPELLLHREQHNKQLVHCNQCHRDVKQSLFARSHVLCCKASTCSICGEQCESTVSMFLHMKEHKTEKLSCNLCQNYFPSESNLQEHVLYNHGLIPFICDICNVSISYKENLRTHISRHVHCETLCKICGEEFASQRGIYNHTLLYHEDKLPNNILYMLQQL